MHEYRILTFCATPPLDQSVRLDVLFFWTCDWSPDPSRFIRALTSYEAILTIVMAADVATSKFSLSHDCQFLFEENDGAR